MKEANPNNKAMQRTTLKDGAEKKKKSLLKLEVERQKYEELFKSKQTKPPEGLILTKRKS